jgi:hypothetical protein
MYCVAGTHGHVLVHGDALGLDSRGHVLVGTVVGTVVGTGVADSALGLEYIEAGMLAVAVAAEAVVGRVPEGWRASV